MIRWMIGLAGILVTGALAVAATGDLTPKPCAAPGSPCLDQKVSFASYRQFAPCQEGEGTVHPGAVVARLTMSAKPVCVAIDSRTKDAKAPEVIRFDFSGAGKFDDVNVVPLKPLDDKMPPTNHVYKFEGDLVIDRGGRPVPVRVTGTYYKSDNYRSLQVRAGTCVEGTCDFGGKVLPIRIVDGNGDFVVGDAPKRVRGGKISADLVRVDCGKGFPKDRRNPCFFGQPVQVEGKWYELTLSPDKTRVTAQLVDVATGQIKIAHAAENAYVTLAGKGHFVHTKVSDQPIAVPADHYEILMYEDYLPDPARNLTLNVGDKDVFVDVTAGEVAVLPVGQTITATLDVQANGGTARISLALKDPSGMKATAMPGAGGKEGVPKVSIYDASGKEVYKCTLEYG